MIRGAARGRDAVVLLQGVVLLLLGVLVSYFGYLQESQQLNLNEIAGPLLFWCAALLLLFRFPFRDALRTSLVSLRGRLGVVFWGYLAVHLLIYGFLLELILASVYGTSFSLVPSLTLSTDAFAPPSLINVLFDLSYSPSISFTVPPILSGVLSLYSISVAVVVDVLLVANLSKVIELGKLVSSGRRAATYFVLPAVGLVLGASCCLSLPALVSFGLPSILSSPAFVWVELVTYFFFPAFAIVVLYLNVLSVDRIASRLASGVGGKVGARAD